MKLEMGAKLSFGRTIGILIVLLQTYGYRLVCDAASTLDACVLKNGRVAMEPCKIRRVG